MGAADLGERGKVTPMAGHQFAGTAVPFNETVDRGYYTIEFASTAFDDFVATSRPYGRDVVFADDHTSAASAVIAREANGTLGFTTSPTALMFAAELPEDEDAWTTAQRDAQMAREQRLMLSLSAGVAVVSYEITEPSDDNDLLMPHLTVSADAYLVELSRVPRPAFLDAQIDFADSTAAKNDDQVPCAVWLAEPAAAGTLVELSLIHISEPTRPY